MYVEVWESIERIGASISTRDCEAWKLRTRKPNAPLPPYSEQLELDLLPDVIGLL